jgi:hypothetical protein
MPIPQSRQYLAQTVQYILFHVHAAIFLTLKYMLRGAMMREGKLCKA